VRISLLFVALLAVAASGESTKQEAFNRLIFTGDVMFSRAVRREILAARDPALPFRKMAPMLAASDIAFVNLESPFSDQGPYREGGLIFHAAPDMIAGLKLAGIAIASTANNHSRDCAAHGVEFTVAWLRAHDYQHQTVVGLSFFRLERLVIGGVSVIHRHNLSGAGDLEAHTILRTRHEPAVFVRDRHGD